MIKLGTLIAPTQRRQAGRQAGRVDNGEISQPSFGLTIKRKGRKKKKETYRSWKQVRDKMYEDCQE